MSVLHAGMRWMVFKKLTSNDNVPLNYAMLVIYATVNIIALHIIYSTYYICLICFVC